MKTPSLIKKVQSVLGKSDGQKKCYKAYLKEIQKQLKKKVNKLKAKLADEKDRKKVKEIEKELAVLKAQRKKVIAAIKDAQC